MEILETKLAGVLILEPRVYHDSRGYFFETFQSERYQELGLPHHFVQDNLSHSVKDVVRGLHYQLERPQGKLVHVSHGCVMDIIVDIRLSSKTFGESICIELSDQNHRQVYIPPGYAHGYCTLSDKATFVYKCTDYYHPPSERGIIWNDPDLTISWPIENAILSQKDTTYLRLKDLDRDQLPI